MSTDSKHIFVRPKKVCFFWGSVLILRSGGFRILGIVYTVQTQVLELDFLVIIFEFFFAYYGKCAYSGCAYYDWGQ